MAKRALITGITGQDGSYLAEILLEKGYEVHGLVRGEVPAGPDARIRFLRGDLRDQDSLTAAVEEAQPDEVYNLAAESSVARSWREPLETGETTGLGAARLLEAVRMVKPDARFFQASSAEMFGPAAASPQSASTPIQPRSPYGAAKAYAHHVTAGARLAHGMHASSGILFNHDSPRRSEEFATRRITLGVAKIKLGLADGIQLGNLAARRDWGFAGDYAVAMWLMLQQDEPGDCAIGTGVVHSVGDVVDRAFECAGLDPEGRVTTATGQLRPTEAEEYVANTSEAEERLGWRAEVTFEGLIEMMVEADLRRLGERA